MRYLLLTVSMFSCADAPDGPADLADSQAPPPSMFLSVSDLIPGQPFDVDVFGAPPGATVYVGATTGGTTPGALCPPALRGECLDLVGARVIGSAVASGSGAAVVSARAPATLPVGATVDFQAGAVGATVATSYVYSATALSPACPATLADFRAETRRIRACTVPADCGTVLSGTSCGCTRDWVARGGVSTTRFYQLLSDAQTCGLSLISTCDCPQTYGFDCVNNVCTWDYTP
jgi:hypothetical protein